MTETKQKIIPYAKQWITDSDRKAVANTLSDDWITRGPKVKEFEQAIAKYVGAEYAVTFNSGSSALRAAFHVAEVSSHDRLLTTPNTFVATVASPLQSGAKLELIDIDPKTGNLHLEKLFDVMNQPSTRGKEVIVPVHFSGIPVDMQGLEEKIACPNTFVIEDGAHAFGATYSDGSKIGNCKWSDLTIFSFHPAKTITTGEGGVVTCNDKVLYEKLCKFRDNGIVRSEKPGYYEVRELTGNYNVTDFQAALGLSQLSRVDEIVNRRRELVKLYKEKLKKSDSIITLFSPDADDRSAHHLFVVQIDFEKLSCTKDELMAHLFEKGIGTQVHYIPLSNHPAVRKYVGQIQLPEMARYYKQALTLPLYYELEEADIDRIVESLTAFIEDKVQP